MARIPDSVVARLKREVSLRRLVEAAGVEIVECVRGEWAGVCPFHPDGPEAVKLTPVPGVENWGELHSHLPTRPFRRMNHLNSLSTKLSIKPRLHTHNQTPLPNKDSGNRGEPHCRQRSQRWCSHRYWCWEAGLVPAEWY